MQKWVYTGFAINQAGQVVSGPAAGQGFYQALEVFGAQGWELIGSFAITNGQTEFVFKRQV